MLTEVARNLRACWKQLAAADLIFKALGFIVLTPLISLLFRLFLAVGGHAVLSDTDIAAFLLHPLGLVTLVTVGAAVLAGFALELALLMVISLGAHLRRTPSPVAALRMVIGSAVSLWRLAARMIGRLLVIAVPFLGAIAGIAYWLLMEHDINFYLAERPREWYLACSLGGVVAAALAAVVILRVSSWVYAAPLLVIEGQSPSAAMAESARRAATRRKEILSSLIAWAGINLLVRLLLSAGIVFLAQRLVGLSTGSATLLVIAVGLMVFAVAAVNTLIGVGANASLASCLAMLYARERSPEPVRLPATPQSSVNLTAMLNGRLLGIGAVVLVLLAGLVGASMLHGIRLEDDVEITAHRGGAHKAPENTLAAIEQGIADGADWAEVDVQESSDGVVMVVHDSDLKRVGGKAVKIWEATAEELRKVNVAAYFPEDVGFHQTPTFDEVLKACKGRIKLNVELKYYGHDQDLERKVAELVEANGMEEDVIYMSMNPRGVAKMKQLRPEWIVGQLTAVTAGDPTRAEGDFLAVRASLATTALVNKVHRQERTVAVWTPNDVHSMSLMISRGVDNLITDRPALARQVVAQRAEMSPLERATLEFAYYLGVAPELKTIEEAEPGLRAEG